MTTLTYKVCLHCIIHQSKQSFYHTFRYQEVSSSNFPWQCSILKRLGGLFLIQILLQNVNRWAGLRREGIPMQVKRIRVVKNCEFGWRGCYYLGPSIVNWVASRTVETQLQQTCERSLAWSHNKFTFTPTCQQGWILGVDNLLRQVLSNSTTCMLLSQCE